MIRFCLPVKIVIYPIRASIRQFPLVKKSYEQSAGFSSAKRPLLPRCFLARKSRYVYNKLNPFWHEYIFSCVLKKFEFGAN